MSKTKEAINQLQKELKKDLEYRQTWLSSISMAYIDCYDSYKAWTMKKSLNRQDLHIIANNAAEYFLKQLCNEIKYPKGR